MADAKQQKPVFLRVIQSTRHEIPIDGDEVANVLAAIGQGVPCKVRQGIINPSYFVGIVEDAERSKRFAEKVKEIEDHNRQDALYDGGRNQRPLPVPRPLPDIFAGANIRGLKAPAANLPARA